jgi:hypothetical protein
MEEKLSGRPETFPGKSTEARVHARNGRRMDENGLVSSFIRYPSSFQRGTAADLPMMRPGLARPLRYVVAG